MSAYKQLNRQDVFISDYVARKEWLIPKADFGTYGIKVYKGSSGSSEFSYLTDQYGGISQGLVYKSLEHNYYYPVGETGSIRVYSGSRDLSLQTTLTDESSRLLPSGGDVQVLSIPQNICGTHIEPSTFSITGSLGVLDDGNGELFLATGAPLVRSTTRVGDIIYNQGIVVITNTGSVNLTTTGSYSVGWNSNLPIYTYNVHCQVKDSEMNTSYNPTLLDEEGEIKEEFTGNIFTPYITSIGLYNGAHELLAVAKLNRPIPKVDNIDMVFIVKLDL